MPVLLPTPSPELAAISEERRQGEAETNVLGTAALDASDAAHIADLDAMQREDPYDHGYIVRRSQARCTACGEDHAWDRRSLTFRPIVA